MEPPAIKINGHEQFFNIYTQTEVLFAKPARAMELEKSQEDTLHAAWRRPCCVLEGRNKGLSNVFWWHLDAIEKGQGREKSRTKDESRKQEDKPQKEVKAADEKSDKKEHHGERRRLEFF